ncbi:hypothetical protein Q5752_006170 [Cryptotrichosporon argae]
MADGTHERRSDADLQKILDGLIGAAGVILSRDLPDRLVNYEKDNELIILDPGEYEGLRALCEAHPDLELGPKDLFDFLSMIPRPQPARPSSPTPPPPLTSSTSAPSSAFPAPAPLVHRRRHSDRVRSPSDNSSSSDDDDRASRQQSAPPASIPFPGAGSASGYAPPPTSYAAPRPAGRRTKTLSDPARSEAAPARRVPPSAYGAVGGFARPSPASRRRRGSNASDLASPDTATFDRSLSTGSVPPAAGYASRPESPFSPADAVDFTSFHRAKSPGTESEVDAADHAMVMDQHDAMDDEVDEVDNDIVDDTMMGMDGSMNPRLSRISTESTASLRTSHDKLRALQKQNSELSRKLKESERQLAVLGSENERLVEDLQERLEEARAELAQRKKDEKDLKNKDRAQLIQISGLEADIQSLQRSLENSKANHASMQKMYNSQCEEAQRLRDMLRDRDAELKDLEASAQAHEADEDKFAREIEALQSEVSRLEADLSVAQQAETYLETQKQENLQLKETIDRMKFDLDEAQRVAKGGHLRAATAASSSDGTLSRNLGDEITRRLNAAACADSDGESVIETIVTTQRTRKIGAKAKDGADVSGEPIVRIEEGIREYADASTETDPLPEPEPEPAAPATPTLRQPDAGPSSKPEQAAQDASPPAYTAEPEAHTRAILDGAHPREPVRGVDDAYDKLVARLGMRCHVLEDEFAKSAARRTQLTARNSFVEKHPNSAAIYNLIFYNSANPYALATWTVAVLAIGLFMGHHFTAPSRDQALFARMNTLALGLGAGEGFLTHGSKTRLLTYGAGLAGVRVPS